MVTLFSLTKDIEIGDNLAWVAEKSMGEAERVYPKEVTNVHSEEDRIQVTAKGVQNGDYYYIVESNNVSKAFVGHPSDDSPEHRGSVAFAQRTDSDELVSVNHRVFDTR